MASQLIQISQRQIRPERNNPMAVEAMSLRGDYRDDQPSNACDHQYSGQRLPA
jgi:hypothetical protein